MLGLCCWQVQDDQRERRVHGLWCGYLFYDGGGVSCINVRFLSCKLELCIVGFGNCCVHL